MAFTEQGVAMLSSVMLYGIPQDRIAKRLGEIRETIRNHLAKMAALPNQPNTDLSRGFTVPQGTFKTEWDGLKSKFSTSIKGGKVKLPSAFPEKGLYMPATILKSPILTPKRAF